MVAAIPPGDRTFGRPQAAVDPSYTWQLREIRSGRAGQPPDSILRRIPMAPIATSPEAREAAARHLNAVLEATPYVQGVVIVDEADRTVARITVWDVFYAY